MVKETWQPIAALKMSGTRFPLGAASDYGFTWYVSDAPVSPKPGDPISIDVTGEIQDLYAGFPDSWAVAVAAAIVDFFGNPEPANRDWTWHKSDQKGKKYPYDNVIAIADNAFILPWHTTLGLGLMPNRVVTYWVQLFACHNMDTPWDWSYWVPVLPG